MSRIDPILARLRRVWMANPDMRLGQMVATIRYKLLTDGPRPEYKSAGASGIDLHAAEMALIDSHDTVTIKTGVCIELPPGCEGQIRPRSSMSARGLLCHLGTIDNDYRGEVAVVLTNLGAKYKEIVTGDRIAQLVIARVERVELHQVEELSATERGAGAFGSTGR